MIDVFCCTDVKVLLQQNITIIIKLILSKSSSETQGASQVRKVTLTSITHRPSTPSLSTNLKIKCKVTEEKTME